MEYVRGGVQSMHRPDYCDSSFLVSTGFTMWQVRFINKSVTAVRNDGRQ